MDPLAEKYFGLSGYVYANNSPACLVDINGKDVDVSHLTDDDQKKGLMKFLTTKNGKDFIKNYLKK